MTGEEGGGLVAAFAAALVSEESARVMLARLTGEERERLIVACERLAVAAYHLCRYCHQDIRGDARAWSGNDTSAWHTGCQVHDERRKR